MQGRQFSSDLRRIREARGISVDDLRNETKIPLTLITAFEETGLFDHPMFNRVYLRSFVRTYAEVVGVVPEEALRGLDEAMAGTYQGSLATAYLGASEPAALPGDEEFLHDGASASERKETPHDASADAESSPSMAPAPVGDPSDWASVSPPPSSYARSSPRAGPSPRFRQWAWIAVGVVALGAVVWFLVRALEAPERGDGLARSAADTAVAFETPVETEPVSPPATVATVSDTMQVTIHATHDRAQGIRVRVDDDLRRPYWIEQGESRTFRATDQVIIERQLDRIRVTVNGREVPPDRRDEEGRVVITRDFAQALQSE
jgi:hypothetical protein